VPTTAGGSLSVVVTFDGGPLAGVVVARTDLPVRRGP
jgi:hypothetical protein